MKKEVINNLYEHFKNSPKKLKIVCDWDEVIQACEPYALWLYSKEIGYSRDFNRYFGCFWEPKDPNASVWIDYNPFGSFLNDKDDKLTVKKQQEIKNTPNFYQETPFLTIAEGLLKLIKEGKVEELIFLSAYDKRKFPHGDERKVKIFNQTFGGFGAETSMSKVDSKFFQWGKNVEPYLVKEIILNLIPFDNETQGQSKVEWVDKQLREGNKIDIVIDDNPNILGNIACLDALKNDNFKETKCSNCVMEDGKGNFKSEIKNLCSKCLRIIPIVCSPYYPAIIEQHFQGVLLVKQEVSNLKKEDFNNYE